MNTSQDKVTELAARIAAAMTADPEVNQEGAWTAQDVLDAALMRGLAEMEKSYLKGGRS